MSQLLENLLQRCGLTVFELHLPLYFPETHLLSIGIWTSRYPLVTALHWLGNGEQSAKITRRNGDYGTVQYRSPGSSIPTLPESGAPPGKSQHRVSF